ncbi:hypothetical protein [uncultured Tenacibaculum sp.]|uniref:hypothetical protein n=1 Tax=uncultured Tenacibaculum sp. TaxID=174713 RepID=UPI002625B16D|nr:hypothetical protein [uncultured Tenacibaculum sp.]
METKQYCEELTGLFIVRKCENLSTTTCSRCSKNICNTHAYKAEKIFTHVDTDTTSSLKQGKGILCISCFTEFDARLTKEIELYSKDRAVWRRKMIERFHKEYPYMLFMAEDYGSLFDTTHVSYFHDHDNDDAYFDS